MAFEWKRGACLAGQKNCSCECRKADGLRGIFATLHFGGGLGELHFVSVTAALENVGSRVEAWHWSRARETFPRACGEETKTSRCFFYYHQCTCWVVGSHHRRFLM
jgi:hypothetical protein